MWIYVAQSLVALLLLTALGAVLGAAVRERTSGRR